MGTVTYLWRHRWERLDKQIVACQAQLHGSLSQAERRKLNTKLDDLLDQRYRT
jgi:hypothetical protein